MDSAFGRQPMSMAHPTVGAPAYPRAGAVPRLPVRPTVPPGAPVPIDYPPLTRRRRKWWQVPVWPFLVAGYSTFGRSFAYLGVPPLFIGELYLVASVYRNRGAWLNRFFYGALGGQLLPLSIMLCVLWGLFEVARPVLLGAPVKEALRTCAFNYYPVFILVGIAIGREMMLAQFMSFWKWFAVFFAVYSMLYPVFGLTVVAPWRPDAFLFNAPALAAFVPVGTMALWPYLQGWWLKWLVVPVGMIPMFFSSGRGAVLGLLFGVLAVAATSVRRFFLVMGLMTALFILGILIGPAFQGEEGRAETLDPMISVARIIATFDEDFAYRMLMDMGYTQAADDMVVAKGTSLWRKQIWMNILATLNTTTRQAIGHGHGEAITELTPDGQVIHTPHNFVFYALYYTGGIGLAVFAFMLFALLLASRRIYDPNLRALQTAHLFMMVVVAAVGNMFETPVAAIPFYLLSGILIGLPVYAPAAVTGRRY